MAGNLWTSPGPAGPLRALGRDLRRRGLPRDLISRVTEGAGRAPAVGCGPWQSGGPGCRVCGTPARPPEPGRPQAPRPRGGGRRPARPPRRRASAAGAPATPGRPDACLDTVRRGTPIHAAPGRAARAPLRRCRPDPASSRAARRGIFPPPYPVHDPPSAGAAPYPAPKEAKAPAGAGPVAPGFRYKV